MLFAIVVVIRLTNKLRPRPEATIWVRTGFLGPRFLFVNKTRQTQRRSRPAVQYAKFYIIMKFMLKKSGGGVGK